MTNQKDELEATEQTDSLVDLPLNELEAEQTNAGSGVSVHDISISKFNDVSSSPLSR